MNLLAALAKKTKTRERKVNIAVMWGQFQTLLMFISWSPHKCLTEEFFFINYCPKNPPVLLSICLSGSVFKWIQAKRQNSSARAWCDTVVKVSGGIMEIRRRRLQSAAEHYLWGQKQSTGRQAWAELNGRMEIQIQTEIEYNQFGHVQISNVGAFNWRLNFSPPPP